MNRVIKYRYWINRKPYIFNIRDIESAMASSEIMSGKYTDRDEYIGLKDKNGKEIYEGDPITFFEYPGKIFKTYFRKECAQFCFISDDGHIELPKFSNININKSIIIKDKNEEN